MLTAKSKYRMACAREELENAARAMETASSWLDMTDMSQTPDLKHLQKCIVHVMIIIKSMDIAMEDML